MHSNKQLYWSNVEFKLKESHPEYKYIKHGLVYVFIHCRDAEVALKKIKKKFKKQDLITTGFQYIEPILKEDATIDDFIPPIKKKLKKAIKTGKVVFDQGYQLTDWEGKRILSPAKD
jgi:hypothetical protein